VVKKNKKLIVSRYTFSKEKKKKGISFTAKIVSFTVAISVILTSVALLMLSKLPEDAFAGYFGVEEETMPAQTEQKKAIYCDYPRPDEYTEKKANRIQEIRYEEYLEHCYHPLKGEMDNVYIYDNRKVCYLTFDDGPSNITPEILDILKQYKVKATFFVQGRNAKAFPEIIKMIYEDGHSIGNHTYSHDYNSVYAETKEGFQNEVTACRDAIDKAIGKKYDNLLFRFPGGYTSLTNEKTKTLYREALSELGYKYIDWSCLTGDSNTTNPTQDYILDTLKYSISNTVTGDIVVLMHDSSTKQITADTLPKVIEYIYEQGYTFDVLKNK